MVNNDLIENITVRFQQGERASEIKEALLNEGWSEGDIEAAFAQIRHQALLQIPIYAKWHNWVKAVDQKTAELPTKTLVQIFIVIGLLFIGGVFVLYYFLDPLGVRSAERDQKREQAAIAIRQSLEKYYKENNATYPSKLDQLVPKYLPVTPLDPRTNNPYEYILISKNMHYEFCVDFEVQVVRCISSDDSSPIPNAPETLATPPVVSLQFAINGQVYLDENKSGERDSAEKAAEGVPVKVTDSSGIGVCETKTDSSGIFNCNLSGKGQYIVLLGLPSGYGSDLGNPIQVVLPNFRNIQPNIGTLFIGLVQ